MTAIAKFPRSELWNNASHCPACGGRTRVYRTVSPRRYRKCLACSLHYSTQEVISGEVERLCGLVDQSLALLEEVVHAGQ